MRKRETSYFIDSVQILKWICLHIILTFLSWCIFLFWCKLCCLYMKWDIVILCVCVRASVCVCVCVRACIFRNDGITRRHWHTTAEYLCLCRSIHPSLFLFLCIILILVSCSLSFLSPPPPPLSLKLWDHWYDLHGWLDVKKQLSIDIYISLSLIHTHTLTTHAHTKYTQHVHTTQSHTYIHIHTHTHTHTHMHTDNLFFISTPKVKNKIQNLQSTTL